MNQLPNIAVAATGQSNVTGNVCVPKTHEAFYYDLDGNLTQDGRWDYTWDAENRLVKMVSRSGAPSGSERWIEFEYDWKGRRIGKQVWNNATRSGSAVLSRKFLYDGWNLLAELDGSNVRKRSFVWGLDLSGSPQGAGGVGGLLMVADASTINGQPSTHFVACPNDQFMRLI